MLKKRQKSATNKLYERMQCERNEQMTQWLRKLLIFFSLDNRRTSLGDEVYSCKILFRAKLFFFILTFLLPVLAVGFIIALSCLIQKVSNILKAVNPSTAYLLSKKFVPTSDEPKIVTLLKTLSPNLFSMKLQEIKERQNISIDAATSLTSDWMHVIRALDPYLPILCPLDMEDMANYKERSIEARAALALMEVIQIQKLELGNSNYVFRVFHSSLQDGNVLLRIYGTSNGAIDRERDILGMECMESTGFSPAILHIFEWGRVEQFLTDSITSTTAMLSSSPTLLKKTYSVMQSMHNCNFTHMLPQTLNKFMLSKSDISNDMAPETYMKTYGDAIVEALKISSEVNPYFQTGLEMKVLEDICPTAFERASLRFLRLLDSVTSEKYKIEFQGYILRELRWMHSELKERRIPVVFSHNDLCPGNILSTSNNCDGIDRVFFVDFEYSDINYRCYDLANSFCELDYSYGRESPSGFVKPLFHKSAQKREDWANKPMEYPRLPILIHECWKQTCISESLLPSLCVNAIKEYFLSDSSQELELCHIQEVFLGMLASHIHWALWSFVMATTGQPGTDEHDCDSYSVGSGGLDYMAYGKCRLLEYAELKKWMLQMGLLSF
eukprot:gene5514-3976_t